MQMMVWLKSLAAGSCSTSVERGAVCNGHQPPFTKAIGGLQTLQNEKRVSAC